MELIFAVSTRFLQMMAEVTVSWLLLDGAIIAQNAMQANISQSETEFYQGKITSAQFYINNILPNVLAQLTSSHSKMKVL